MEIRLFSSLEKIFIDEMPAAKEQACVSGFQNEILSFQAVVYDAVQTGPYHIDLTVDSPIADTVKVRVVRHVPVRYAAPAVTDDNYLRKTPGLYPDLLTDYTLHSVILSPNTRQAFWIDVDASKAQPGTYPVTLLFKNDDGLIIGACTQKVRILPGFLPAQKLIHTKWFHCDALANYYRVPAFSEEHWRIIENFASRAVRGGINMLLMPVHTPELDTRIGGERLTTQLVDITIENGQYHFDMAKVRRWIDMCKRVGVQYYEVAHLYSQWGAYHAPKVMATVDGEYKQIFGWDTDALSDEYRTFLRTYIPALKAVFAEEGIADHVFWHISDEPSPVHLEQYLNVKNQVADLLKDQPIMDALSSFEFYKKGVVKTPVVSVNHLHPFIDDQVPDLWCYYCCSQHDKVTNMFIAMPSARNRILGILLYRYQMRGFLQWGYNFYNSHLSDRKIDPFFDTDAGGMFPAGDPFQVYPGEDGQPLDSIRIMVTQHAMQDLRALEWLEEKHGRDYVLAFMEKEGFLITPEEYPHEAEKLLAFRDHLNLELLKD